MSEPKFLPYRMVSGTIAASSFVAITQLVTRSDIEGLLYYATICFSFTVPMMTAYYLYPPTFERAGGKYPLSYSVFHLGYIFCLLAAFTGFSLLFFSFGILPGIGFVIAVFFSNKVMLVGSINRAHENGFK